MESLATPVALGFQRPSMQCAHRNRAECPKQRFPNRLAGVLPLLIALGAPSTMPPNHFVAGDGAAPAEGRKEKKILRSGELTEDSHPILGPAP